MIAGNCEEIYRPAGGRSFFGRQQRHARQQQVDAEKAKLAKALEKMAKIEESIKAFTK